MKSINTGIPENIKQEINSVLVEFNKSANENISILETKIDEAKSLVKHLNNINIHDTGSESNNESSEVKKAGKYELIDIYLKQKIKPVKIAKILGISITEVNLYIKLKKQKSK